MTRLTILALAVLVAASGAASAQKPDRNVTAQRVVEVPRTLPQMQRPVWCGLIPALLGRCR